MKELIDKCEHCGNLNRSGALHCDVCGKGLSANLAVKYKECTKKSRNHFIICGVSAALAAVLLVFFGDTDFNSETVSALLAFTAFLACATAMITVATGLSHLLSRNRYKYSENTELALKGEPEDTVIAAESGNANHNACPSCGNRFGIKKDTVCKYCGYNPANQTGESGKSRLSDETLVKSMERYNKRANFYLALAIPFIITAIIAASLAESDEFSVYVLMCIVSFIIAFILIVKCIGAANTATEMFKVNIVRDALAELIDGCVFRSRLSIGRQRIEATELISGWNKFRGNDYIRGMYNGRQIELSDIHLEEESEEGSGDNKRTVTRTIFRGQWIACKLDKKLPAVVRLREGEGKGNAETENMAFNNKYQIYTDDPHYMFYVLTPHFMEYIIAADEAAKARTFFYFAGGTAHIAVDSGRDAFEIPADKAARNNPTIAREQIKNEMKYITDILDELFLNEYLF